MVLPTLYKLILFTIIGFVLLATLPGFLDIHPKSIAVKPCPEFRNTLNANYKLDDVEKLLENEIEGPESIAFYKGELFTGLADGRIVQIKNNKVKTVVQLKKCEGIWEEHICGRPLGMRFDERGQLFVANAYFGLLKVDIDTGKVQVIYSSQTEIDGKESKIVNDLDISKNGDIYFSDSGRWPLMKGVYEFLEAAPNGRILHYDAAKKTTKVLVHGISFANGVQLSPNEDFLLISESLYHRVLKYHLKGTKQGQLEVFIDNVPGVADNIRLNPRGNYWLAQCSTRLPGHKNPLEYLGNFPLLRRVFARIIHLFQSTVWFVKENLVSSVILDQLWYRAAHLHPYASLGTPHYGLILEVDQNGKIINSLHSPKGSMYFISEVHEHDNYLYLGSPWHKFIGKVELR